jgi:hypothetical protein
MKHLITLMAVLFSATTFGQNVGIGEPLPTNGKLTVKATDSAVLLLHNNTLSGTDVKTGLFFKTGPSYSGALASVGTSFTHRLGLFTFGGSGPNSLLERFTVTDGGNIGIGTTTPSSKLEINGQIKITGGSPGVGQLLESDATGLATWVDKSASLLPVGATGNTLRYSGVGWVSNSLLYNNGTNIGIGTTSPTSPLSFPATLSKKISLYPGATGDAGFGVFGNELRINADNVNADITLGYDNFSTGFSEKMRVKGNGNVGIGTNNPNSKLEVFGAGFGITQNDGTVSVGTYTSATGGWIGTRTNHALHFFSNNSAERMTLSTAGNVGIGNTSPLRPLSFPAVLGKKISLYPGATGDAGFGVFGNELRINSDNASADITFGFDNFSTGFTENARLFGGGNMHLGKYSAWATAADNRKINFGDGDFAYIGEVGADDRLELNAGAFNFKTGDVFIGTNDFIKGAGYKLRVGGKIFSEEVRVQLQAAWPDYVFDKKYKKLSLEELEKYVDEHKHLPNIPSAAEVEKDGQHLGEIQRKMLEKIEELSLYVIELKKEIDLLKSNK